MKPVKIAPPLYPPFKETGYIHLLSRPTHIKISRLKKELRQAILAGETRRYSTWEEAEKGHNNMVQQILKT
jgi:hypothetical protein